MDINIETDIITTGERGMQAFQIIRRNTYIKINQIKTEYEVKDYKKKNQSSNKTRKYNIKLDLKEKIVKTRHVCHINLCEWNHFTY